MGKEIIQTIKVNGDILHGIINEDLMRFVAVGNTSCLGEYTTILILKEGRYKILKETIIEWDDSDGE